MFALKIAVSNVLKGLYESSHKNYEYALDYVINSLDPDCYKKAIDDIAELKIKSERVEIEIPETIVDSVKQLMDDDVSAETIELLLWVAVLFPEI